MPSSIKLTTAEHRAWRVNKAQWVSPEGVVLRAVTPEEEKAIFPAVERTKAVGKTQSYPLTVVYRQEDPDSGVIYEQKTQMEATVRVTITGRERHNYVLDVFVNGCRYVKGREIIEKRMLATHGECNLHGPNGKRIRVIRNPLIKRPSYSESMRNAPHPDNCGCRAWKDKGSPGRHHAACEWNSKAPPHERAQPFLQTVERTIVESPEPLESLAFDPTALRRAGVPLEKPSARTILVPPPAQRMAPAAVVRQPTLPGQIIYADPTLEAPQYAVAAPLSEHEVQVTRTQSPAKVERAAYAPSACPDDCRGLRRPAAAWRWPEGRKPEKGQHHPLCEYDGAYRARTRVGQRWMIYDLVRRTEIREATADEVVRSELELQKHGTRSLAIAGTIYALVQSGPVEPSLPRQAAPVLTSGQEAASKQAAADARRSAAEERRQELLDESDLPAVPQPRSLGRVVEAVRDPRVETQDAFEAVDEMTALRARLAELEARELLRQPIGAVAATPPPFALAPVQAAAIARPADYLRNELGLVGHQQATDDIATGPVMLVDPEPFIDPMIARRSSPASAFRPKGFVPPDLPGHAAPPAPASEPPEAVSNALLDADETVLDGGSEAEGEGEGEPTGEWLPEPPRLDHPGEQPSA